MFVRLKKWFLLYLILIIVLLGVRNTGNYSEESFWEIGKQTVKEYFSNKMLYGHSTLLGFIRDLETVLWREKPHMVTESFLDVDMESIVYIAEEEIEHQVKEENGAVFNGSKEEFYFEEEPPFRPVTEKQVTFALEKYNQLDALIKQFYIIDPTTQVAEELFDVTAFKEYDCKIDKGVEGPQILLYHTHSQEAFVDSVAGKEEDTILGAGEILAKYLEEYGFHVLHHKGKYDVQSRDNAYNYALPEVEKILEDNPGIQVVIDLHRDAVAEETRLVTDIQGKQVAKVMFFNGLSRSVDTGPISYLENPYLKENLAFSFQMKLACDEYYPGFARSIYLRAYRYNMHLCPKTLLVELGAQTNTTEEIKEALAPLAHVLSIVLGEKET